MTWKSGKLESAEILSRQGKECVLRTTQPIKVARIKTMSMREETEWGVYYVTRFKTKTGKTYRLKTI